MYTWTLSTTKVKAIAVNGEVQNPSTEECPFVVASNLTKGFTSRRRTRGKVLAVDNVSLTLPRGRTLGIVGESGAGKSTVGRMLLRLIEPDSGELMLDNVDLLALSPKMLRRKRADMQMIFQDPYSTFDRRATIQDILLEPLKLHFDIDRAEGDVRIEELLGKVGLGTHVLNRRPSELSGGQLQRISIARSLAPEPKLLVCDEAVAALDMSTGAGILNLLLELQERDAISIVFISHDLRAIRAVSDEVMVMRLGRVIENKTAEALFDDPEDSYTKDLLMALPGHRVRAHVPG